MFDEKKMEIEIEDKQEKKAFKKKSESVRSQTYVIKGSKKMLGNETIILKYDFLPVKSFKLPAALTVELSREQYDILKSNPSIILEKE